MPREQLQHRPDVASFRDLAPLLDELTRLAEETLHHPFKIKTTVWDDGDYRSIAEHIYGRYAGTDVSGREVLTYDRDREAFIVRYVETDGRTGETTVCAEETIGDYPDPLQQ
jgi:hypothetical protein